MKTNIFQGELTDILVFKRSTAVQCGLLPVRIWCTRMIVTSTYMWTHHRPGILQKRYRTRFLCTYSSYIPHKPCSHYVSIEIVRHCYLQSVHKRCTTVLHSTVWCTLYRRGTLQRRCCTHADVSGASRTSCLSTHSSCTVGSSRMEMQAALQNVQSTSTSSSPGPGNSLSLTPTLARCEAPQPINVVLCRGIPL